MRKLFKLFKLIKHYKETDPVYKCTLYKKRGCAHVDGMLCNYDTCRERILFEIRNTEMPEGFNHPGDLD